MTVQLRQWILLLAFIPVIGMNAQEAEQTTTPPAEVRIPQFGYLSYKSIYQQMPEYAQAQTSFSELKAKYEAEAKRSEEEFQRKFAEFLQGQKDFPPSIMQKRQAELQELMDKSISFRQESQRLLRQAEEEMKAPVTNKLNDAIKAVATQLSLVFVLNTDDNAVPFIHPQVGVNVTEPVMQKLGLSPQSNLQPAQ